MTRSSTKRTADMAEQPTVQPHVGDIGDVEDVEHDAPSVSLSHIMDVMTRRLERLLAQQDERGAKLFDELFDGRCREVALTDSDVTAADSVDAVKRVPIPVKRRKRAKESASRVKRAKESASRVKRRKRAKESASRVKRRKRAKESASRVKRRKRAKESASRVKRRKRAKESASRVKRRELTTLRRGKAPGLIIDRTITRLNDSLA